LDDSVSLVPALVSEVPITPAISPLVSPAKNFSPTTLALAWLEAGDRRSERGPPNGHLGGLVGGRERFILGFRRELRPPGPAPELVERGVPRDPEQPGPPASPRRIECAPPPVGALERLRGHVLGSGPIPQEAGDIRVDVVAARAVELLERRVGVAGRPSRGCHKRLGHARTTRG
jgi:hypothetical protein